MSTIQFASELGNVNDVLMISLTGPSWVGGDGSSCLGTKIYHGPSLSACKYGRARGDVGLANLGCFHPGWMLW